MNLKQVAAEVIADAEKDPTLAAKLATNFGEVVAERMGITTDELLQALDDGQLNEVVGGRDSPWPDANGQRRCGYCRRWIPISAFSAHEDQCVSIYIRSSGWKM